MNLIYDLGRAPASWDFLQWLIHAEMVRRDRQDTKPLGICFKPGPKDGFRDDKLPRPVEQRQAILDSVMRPALLLIGAHEVSDGAENIIPYLTRFAVEMFKIKGEVPFYRAPKYTMDEVSHDLKGRRPFVITLREAGYWPQRNSNLDSWLTFAKECGEDVIFVRDTAKADEPIAGFETYPRASRELLYRAALMSHARMNFMVSGGPITLAINSKVPWLCFGALTPGVNYKPGQPEWWTRQMGCPVGTQFPWSGPLQRMAWTSDTIDNIRAAWDALKPFLNSPARVAC